MKELEDMRIMGPWGLWGYGTVGLLDRGTMGIVGV